MTFCSLEETKKIAQNIKLNARVGEMDTHRVTDKRSKEKKRTNFKLKEKSEKKEK